MWWGTDVLFVATVADVVTRIQLAFVNYHTGESIPNLRYPPHVFGLSSAFLASRGVWKHVEVQWKLEFCLQLSTTRVDMLKPL